MRAELLDLLTSAVALCVIPVAIITVIAIVGRYGLRRDWPSLKEWLTNNVISVVITLGITLSICLIFRFVGFTDMQFYRPSKQDYGQIVDLGLTPEERFFTSSDGTRLHGWLLAGEGEVSGTVVCFHGSDRNISYTVGNVAWLTERGFNVFLFDYRGYGASEGSPEREGIIEDCVAAIDAVAGHSQVDGDHLVLYGQSMGGQLAINAAVATNNEAIKLVIAEATYARHSYHVSDKIGQLGPLWLVKWGVWLLTSDAWSAEPVIDQLSVPVLLIHGTDDRGVLPYHSQRLFDAANQPKHLWTYDGYGHLRIFQEPKNQTRLANFIRETIADE